MLKNVNDYSNRRIVSAFHPPCWTLRPWELAFSGEPFTTLDHVNHELDEDFLSLWILIFEGEHYPLIGYCILPRDVDLLPTEVIVSVYLEHAALHRVAVETINGRLGLLMGEY